jgi:hypothetical protein
MVFITGLGNVPATGHFTHLLPSDTLEFRDSSDGAAIVKVPIQETVIVMGPPTTLQLPEAGEFPSYSRPGVWRGSGSFISRANQVLGTSFPIGYEVKGADTNQPYFITTYASLDALPRNVFGEIAVLLSFQQGAFDGEKTFAIKFKALERRSHSPEWLTPESEEVIKAATRRVDLLMNELNK